MHNFIPQPARWGVEVVDHELLGQPQSCRGNDDCPNDFGASLNWGARGREFESPRPDHFSTDSSRRRQSSGKAVKTPLVVRICPRFFPFRFGIRRLDWPEPAR
jgi:hypothetical protein